MTDSRAKRLNSILTRNMDRNSIRFWIHMTSQVNDPNYFDPDMTLVSGVRNSSLKRFENDIVRVGCNSISLGY